jgi:enterochelin esterase-like enzyme
LPKVDLTLFSFYLSCGTYETNVANTGSSFIDMHYRMRDQLRTGRARFGYREVAAGHSWGFWRDDLPQLLKYLFPAERIAQTLD